MDNRRNKENSEVSQQSPKSPKQAPATSSSSSSSSSSEATRTPMMEDSVEPVKLTGAEAIVWEYLDSVPLMNDTKNQEQDKKYKLFGKNYQQITGEMVVKYYLFELDDITLVKQVEDRLKLLDPQIFMNPICFTDRQGRKIYGSPIQIVAMNSLFRAFNFDLIDFATSAGLPNDDVRTQIYQALSSDLAQLENNTRRQYIFELWKTYAEELVQVIQGNYKAGSEAYNGLILGAIANFKLAMTKEASHIKAGYVFDPHILLDAMQWLKEKKIHIKFNLFGTLWDCGVYELCKYMSGIQQREIALMTWPTSAHDQSNFQFKNFYMIQDPLLLSMYEQERIDYIDRFSESVQRHIDSKQEYLNQNKIAECGQETKKSP